MKINRTILKACVQLFFLSIAATFIASCASKSSPVMVEKSPPVMAQKSSPVMVEKSPPVMAQKSSPVMVGKSPPAEHVWQYLYSYGTEDYDYATYSYVLVGRDGSNHNATLLYISLVSAIKGSTAEADNISKVVSTNTLNLFLIPAIKKEGDVLPMPNYKLSKSLLTVLSASSPTKFTNPGPYIITLYRPISDIKQDDVADILYIDLTNMHPTAMRAVVSTYKRKILEENISGIEKLSSLRLSLLKALLITEDSIGFAQTAYAELRRAFFK